MALQSKEDRLTQAILPLRGKLLGEKARLDKVLNNAEIRSLITAVGTGIGDHEGEGSFDSEKARYHKIIIIRMRMSMALIFVPCC